MLQFSEDYFQEEVRCGFTVSATMKRYWAAQMEVLQTVAEICDKHNLTYYAFWGTLLGAVRHQGFIPWDDDIDIALKREDYLKLLRIAEKELPVGWHMRSIYTEEEWTQYHSIITNELVIDISEERLKRFHGCPFVVGVDVYPLDYLPSNLQEAQAQKLLLSMVHAVVTSVKYLCTDMQDATPEKVQETRETVEQGLVELEKICHISFDRSRSLENQLFRLFDKISMLYSSQDTDRLTFYPFYIKDEKWFWQEEWFGITQMPFENMVLKAPSNADKVLQTNYGDYMVFERNAGRAHDYPLYKRELATLHEKGLWLDVQE